MKSNTKLMLLQASMVDAVRSLPQYVALEAFVADKDFPSIEEAFKKGTDNTLATMAMCKRVIMYSKSIASKDEHLSFFGGNLLGVDRIRWYDTDRDRWFDEVLQIDESYLQECIYKVRAEYKDWNVATDAFNLSIVWFCHRCLRDLNKNDKVVHEAMVEALVMMQFRFLSSLYTHQFDKPVDHAAAEAVYSALTMKFSIKRLGSWGAVLKSRAESFLDTKNTKGHYKDFVDFKDDERTRYIVTDMSTRVRKSIKDQYAVLDAVRGGNLRIESGSNILTLDGEKIVKDQLNLYTKAKNYLLDVSGNESSFIKLELLNLVLDYMTTTSRQSLLDVLQSISRTPTGKGRDEVESFMEDTLMHAFDYIAKERLNFKDVGFLLTKMRGLYTSNKTSDPRLLSLRTRLEAYARKNSALKAPSALASVRTSIMLYFLLRALSANVYT